MKTWSSREVILILDFVDFLGSLKSQYRDACLKYYFHELTQVLPEFSKVPYRDFAALVIGLCDNSIDPELMFEGQEKYVNTFKNSRTKHFIVDYATEYKKQLRITDCNNALLTEIWFPVSGKLEEYEVSISDLEKENRSREYIYGVIDSLLTPLQVQETEINANTPDLVEERVTDDYQEECILEEHSTNFERTIKEYFTGKPYYNSITFSDNRHPKSAPIPTIYSATLYLIDKQLSQGRKRMTVVMPDSSNLMALFASRVIRSEMEGPFDPFENLRGVKPGQKMRIGKAVIQIESIKEDSFQYLCKDLKCTEVRSDKKTWYQYLEKVDSGTLNKFKHVKEEINRIEDQVKSNVALQVLMSNKDAVANTTVLLTTKNSVDEFSKECSVLGSSFSKVFSVGEFSLNPPGFISKNKHCEIPNFTVAIELAPIITCASEESIREKIDCVFVTQEKVRELLANRFLFERFLKLDIPVIVFLSETDYERFSELSKYDFSLFHWKPSTLTDISFSKNANYYSGTVFENLVKKTQNASKATFELKLCDGSDLSSAHKKVKKLINMCDDFDQRFQDLIWRIWRVYAYLISDYYSMELNIPENPITGDIVSIYQEWNEQKKSYDSEIVNAVEDSIECLRQIAYDDNSKKFESLCKAVKMQVKDSKKIAVVVPDQQVLPETLQRYFEQKYGSQLCVINVFTINQYLIMSKNHVSTFDYVNVLWFDKNDYLRIKNTYSYHNLVYFLYDFEERRRYYFRKEFDDCLQHAKTISTAGKLGISDSIKKVPFDETTAPNNINYSDPVILDYESALQQIYGIDDEKQQGNDVVSGTLIVSKRHRVIYLPTHRVIDVSEVIAGGDRIIQKPVQELQRGDFFVVRESERDIIAEAADGLIGNTANKFREEAGLWVACLGILINDYGFDYVYKAINRRTFCTKQQLSYWSWGVTICPDNPKVIETIAELCSRYSDKDSIYFRKNYKTVYEKGKKLQRIHMIAGKLINQRLRKKHKEILDIYNAGGRGQLSGIGNVIIIEVEAINRNQIVNRTQLRKLEEL